MDSFFRNVSAHISIHGRFFLPPFFQSSTEIADQRMSDRRSRLIGTTSTLRNVKTLIRSRRPDLLVLNEVPYQAHHRQVESFLRREGFRSIAWGLGEHYSDMTVSTVAASRFTAAMTSVCLPMLPHFGGGGGATALRVDSAHVTVVAVHLAIRRFNDLFVSQMQTLETFGLDRQAAGDAVVFMGDWNASMSHPAIQRFLRVLCLTNATPPLATFPTFFPLGWSLDHIFIPDTWAAGQPAAVAFGSDHRALFAQITPSADGLGRAGAGSGSADPETSAA
jgi:endonuclease/exonuclease/phosphatase (EEP) superfamily protein YafD